MHNIPGCYFGNSAPNRHFSHFKLLSLVKSYRRLGWRLSLTCASLKFGRVSVSASVTSFLVESLQTGCKKGLEFRVRATRNHPKKPHMKGNTTDWGHAEAIQHGVASLDRVAALPWPATCLGVYRV